MLFFIRVPTQDVWVCVCVFQPCACVIKSQLTELRQKTSSSAGHQTPITSLKSTTCSCPVPFILSQVSTMLDRLHMRHVGQMKTLVITDMTEWHPALVNDPVHFWLPRWPKARRKRRRKRRGILSSSIFFFVYDTIVFIVVRRHAYWNRAGWLDQRRAPTTSLRKRPLDGNPYLIETYWKDVNHFLFHFNFYLRRYQNFWCLLCLFLFFFIFLPFVSHAYILVVCVSYFPWRLVSDVMWNGCVSWRRKRAGIIIE